MRLISLERVAEALAALALGLVICGFLLTQSLDDPQTGGILLFAGVAAGVVLLAGAGIAPAMADRGFPLVLLVLTLGLAPAVLAIMEIFHPHGFSSHVYVYLSTSHHLYFGPKWWIALHLVQTPLVAAVGFGLLLATRGIPGALAWIARIVTALFIVYYAVLDTIAGVAVGVLINHTTGWTGARGMRRTISSSTSSATPLSAGRARRSARAALGSPSAPSPSSRSLWPGRRRRSSPHCCSQPAVF